MICQVAQDVDLPCPARESGGYQCENLEPLPHHHFIGNHTIEHSLAGNGYACTFEEDS